MKLLRKMVCVVVLVGVVGVSALAGETQTPCGAPGETQTPCSTALTTDSNDLGQTATPPTSDSVDVVILAEDALESLLTLL